MLKLNFLKTNAKNVMKAYSGPSVFKEMMDVHV